MSTVVHHCISHNGGYGSNMFNLICRVPTNIGKFFQALKLDEHLLC